MVEGGSRWTCKNGGVAHMGREGGGGVAIEKDLSNVFH